MKLNNAWLQTEGLLISRVEVVSPSVGFPSSAEEVSDKDWMPACAGMTDLHFAQWRVIFTMLE